MAVVPPEDMSLPCAIQCGPKAQKRNLIGQAPSLEPPFGLLQINSWRLLFPKPIGR
jgi:hypothetical protein